MRRLAILTLVLMLASGCAGRNFNLSDADRVQIGMTESEVQQIMGEPTDKQVRLTSQVWMWIYVTTSSSKSFGVRFDDGRVTKILK